MAPDTRGYFWMWQPDFASFTVPGTGSWKLCCNSSVPHCATHKWSEFSASVHRAVREVSQHHWEARNDGHLIRLRAKCGESLILNNGEYIKYYLISIFYYLLWSDDINNGELSYIINIWYKISTLNGEVKESSMSSSMFIGIMRRDDTLWGPLVISWFINPSSCHIGTINHTYWSYKPT